MLDRGRGRRVTGSIFDDELGADVPTYETFYTGKCAVRDGSSVRLTGTGLSVEGLVLAAPVRSGVWKIGDLFTVDYSELDPELVGVEFVVTALAKGSRLTARRMQIVEVDSR